MTYLGSWKIDDLLTFTIVTTRVDTGAATDADSAPAYRVYEDETATPILTGTMALLDSGNTAGFYSEQITLSAANGFEKGKSYNIYIQATVNSVIGATTRNLQIEAEVDANTVSPTVNANVVQISGDSGAADNAETAFDGGSYNVGGGGVVAASVTALVTANVTQLGGGAQSLADLKDFADDGYDPATNKVQGVVLVDTLTTYTGNTPQTGDAFARIGANGSGLTALGDTRIANLDATVSSRASQASVTAIGGDVTAIGVIVTAIKAKTDQLTFTIANKVDSSIQAAGDFAQAAADKVWLSAARTLTSFGTLVADIWASATRTLTSFGTLTADAADKLLGRNLAGGSDGGRTVQDALRVLRNRRTIAAGTLTVYAEDDATPAWDAAVATAASDPINSIDPA